MKILLACLAIILPSAAIAAPVVHWNEGQAARLIEWLEASRDDALSGGDQDAGQIRAAMARSDQAQLDELATASAIRLMRAHRDGCCNAALRDGWHIDNGLSRIDIAQRVADAVAADRIDEMFGQMRPRHPYYFALRAAYASERDPERKATLAANLDRWRWMPREFSGRYLLVNTAAFEASLWQGQTELGRWQIIVGKTGSPTPIFSAKVTGVILNPWWEIPTSIVRESVGKLVATRPAEAARRGYVVEEGRYRQRPGPNNALGRMKLVMPNPYTVYLHDTPSQSLFARDVRTFSHGCVRVGDALGLAASLLSSMPQWDRKHVDAAVASGKTQTVSLPAPMPVYVAYFTAEPDGAGGVRYFPDVYKRDGNATAPDDNGRCTQ